MVPKDPGWVRWDLSRTELASYNIVQEMQLTPIPDKYIKNKNHSEPDLTELTGSSYEGEVGKKLQEGTNQQVRFDDKIGRTGRQAAEPEVLQGRSEVAEQQPKSRMIWSGSLPRQGDERT